MRGRPKVMVLGGGFGGLETSFYLRHTLKDRADITLVSEHEYFLFKPNAIYIPFGEDPERLKIRLDKPTRKKYIEFIRGRVGGVEPDPRTVRVDGNAVSYDFLVVATGADMGPWKSLASASTR